MSLFVPPHMEASISRLKASSPPPGGAVGLVAGGREMVVGADVVLLVDGLEMEGVLVHVHKDGTIQALPGPDVLLAARPPRLDRLSFGADWRWPSDTPTAA